VEVSSVHKKTAEKVRRMKPADVDKMLARIKVPKEFSRKTRHLADGMKAEELRNISLFFFPVVVANLPTKGIQRIWLRFTYLMRIFSASEEEFDRTASGLKHRTEITQELLVGIFHNYGEDVGTYNVHGLLHLEAIRKHGPLATTSAVPYEASFGHVRRSFVPGTPSITKQIMTEMFVR
jgi:hypothetical protein